MHSLSVPLALHCPQAVAAGTWGALPALPVPLGETAAGILINPKNGANWLVLVGEGGCLSGSAANG